MPRTPNLSLSIHLARARWMLHRTRVRKGIRRPFSKVQASRWLIISAPDPICTAQVFPFFFYAGILRCVYGIELREITLQDFSGRAPYRDGVDVVCFQTWFDMTEAQLLDLIRRLKATYPGARLVYLDWFAPTDLRYAEILDREVDIYIKKHVLRDRSAYGRSTLGDTNLTDYYSRRFGLPLDPVVRNIPDSFWPKLIVGPNFAFSPQILPLLGKTPRQVKRLIDVHARIAVAGVPWYTAMRREALEAVERLRGLHVVCHGRISRQAYVRELFSSKICFSPFGYGEVCWRDYEAVLGGALLVKPDMAHIETCPDIFRPFETYVPTRWDLSDLEEKIQYYLAHDEERIAIADRAHAVIQDYVTGQGFEEQMGPMFQQMLQSANPQLCATLARTL